MASYPTTPKTFTSKNTGDVIQATHVNDLQDEVNAIETGLLQGSAPLNSSNSTVAHLSAGTSTFSGAVTMAAALQVTGQSSFTTRPLMPAELARVYLDTVKDMASSVASTVAFLSVASIYNANMFSTVAAHAHKLCPAFSTGWYRFVGQFYIRGVASADVFVQADIQDSSNKIIGTVRHFYPIAMGAGFGIQVEGMKLYDTLDGLAPANTTHYCKLRYGSGGGSTVSLSTGSSNCSFTMYKV